MIIKLLKTIFVLLLLAQIGKAEAFNGKVLMRVNGQKYLYAQGDSAWAEIGVLYGKRTQK
ncbi:MAG: hypothetical protein HOD28_05605 [Candidatus Marinimicrobia bacterium]|mgnify:CR=1 FL=1|jgi:hypothetical protein|nr:hypothetical protein [Candidatus Neomarinimicrobiota bacterium]MBT4578810.1 hypothetical protein [Candidatus Neomarinimicrobiota bacterium]MBT5759498.1 hypothetical protein [Candidatus Neomarinimicrobiota bacterium]